MSKKVVLITGASSGMGKVTALHLLQAGYTVYGAARRVELMQELEQAGGHPLKMDVTDADQVKAAVEQIMAQEGRIDVLINNAGYGSYGSVEETSIEEAKRQFEVNNFGLARLTQAVIPHMRKQGAGRIINISSMGGKIYFPLGAWYHASKHALEGWSDCLRIELKPFGIDVVIIEPGVIATEFGEVMSEPLLERSGQGPYAKMAKTMAKMTQESYQKPNAASPAHLIAETIAQAIQAKRPKTRYVAGKMARPMILLRKIFGDRIYDQALFGMLK
ncbi:short-chain dehydrogenase/reductase [bacterium (Candidatus Blackallbacteria) CG17_big_fil_post_rev_8_21_14_2_50_48_46]|uniref:Short-chain dehydrogenase/reductase n=1 Tax=bacterium (Candidatus Blackallbacteria) CG17_big_fil_post_rev_8_21_14_2_50_48_46 TaxID=2014261 RepID=A0A2M7G152_9BACT|nr:MAG: short-chain dehydrogenase/reductase [bacterium (Candidatus Blackallbacteria) CG18_big_fil_WC_8_21_14_2_50_49_26]PIW15267.1 MAG: short-chain dehydrogenase/reductase [bacterium (Candidatus Blackallbacteria) CG17_big_fil_post_rev_8_21_14_2_50_48_46]PIW45224.1 MAG: short-chain dehydrogenase/reductase [bacterium (Candidatus Blackallbacteria) CG13_big_fil_rev_8_21_14_2_50_49_14]